MHRWTDFFIAVCYKSAVKYILSYWEACLFGSTVKPFTWAGHWDTNVQYRKKRIPKNFAEYRRTHSNFIQWAKPSSDVTLFYGSNSVQILAVLLFLIVMVSGVGAKRLPTASNFQRLCLRNLWMAIPRESRRSHVPVTAKALLIIADKKRKLIKRSFFHHCGTIIYCACVVEAIKNLSDISIMAKVIEKL